MVWEGRAGQDMVGQGRVGVAVGWGVGRVGWVGYVTVGVG